MNSESGREERAPALLARRLVVCVRACERDLVEVAADE